MHRRALRPPPRHPSVQPFPPEASPASGKPRSPSGAPVRWYPPGYHLRASVRDPSGAGPPPFPSTSGGEGPPPDAPRIRLATGSRQFLASDSLQKAPPGSSPVPSARPSSTLLRETLRLRTGPPSRPPRRSLPGADDRIPFLSPYPPSRHAPSQGPRAAIRAESPPGPVVFRADSPQGACSGFPSAAQSDGCAPQAARPSRTAPQS